MRTKAQIVLIVICLVLFLNSCNYAKSQVTNSEKELPHKENLVIDNAMGKTVVTTWEKDFYFVTIRKNVTVTKKDQLLSAQDLLKVEFTEDATKQQIQVRYPNTVPDYLRDFSVDLEVKAPGGTKVQVNGSTGEIEVTNLTTVKLTSVSGKVTGKNLNGNVEIRSQGDIHLTDLTGQLLIYQTTGKTEITRLKGQSYIVSSMGEITLQNAELTDGYIRSETGKVRIGGLKLNGTATIITAMGQIDLGVEGSDFAVNAYSEMGTLNLAEGIHQEFFGKFLKGVYGEPTSLLNTISNTGSIAISLE